MMSVWAGVACAVRIQAQSVIGNDKALGQCDIVLAFFNFSVVKLFDLTAIETDHVVVMLAFVQFIDGFAAFKMVSA
jgi:hypothetical protein